MIQLPKKNVFAYVFITLVAALGCINIMLAMKTQTLANDPKTTLEAQALFKEGAPPIEDGIIWHVYKSEPDENGRLPLVATRQKPKLSISLMPDDYLITVAYGHAAISQRINLDSQPLTLTLILNAGALHFTNQLSTGRLINPEHTKNTIFQRDFDESIIVNAEAGKYYRLPSGSYRIVSLYGNANALSTTNAQIEPGKLSDVIVYHQARQITFKLVRAPGGSAQVNTSWKVTDATGDIIAEADSAIATIILAEGRYQVTALKEGRRYQQTFTIVPGPAIAVEVPMINQ